MRGIALKIFLTFWFIFAVLIASFAVLPDEAKGFRFADHLREHGLVAAGLYEQGGRDSCDAFATVLSAQAHVQLVLTDSARHVVCRAATTDLAPYAPLLETSGAKTSSGAIVSTVVRAPSGATFTAFGTPLTGFTGSETGPPFPIRNFLLTVVVSGIVCFLMARSIARVLQDVRDASHRLAAGDLNARAAPAVASRRDEIGDLVRDFNAMAGRIEALVGSHRQLLSDMSHELRSPLARLNVALALARRRAGDAVQGDLARIELEAERMNELIGRILSLARAEHSAQPEASEAFELSDVVQQVSDDAQFEATQQDKAVTLRVVADATLVGQPQLLASAIDNVVRNGVRYTPAHSSVDVVVDATTTDALVRVRDHGPGVPPAELERMFVAFHRVEADRSPQSGGVGLGLAIAQRAVGVHGGTITAENHAEGGLEVTIRVPRESSRSVRRPVSQA